MKICSEVEIKSEGGSSREACRQIHDNVQLNIHFVWRNGIRAQFAFYQLFHENEFRHPLYPSSRFPKCPQPCFPTTTKKKKKLKADRNVQIAIK